jgi:tetraprenyl-beta-curcumene synthase
MSRPRTLTVTPPPCAAAVCGQRPRTTASAGARTVAAVSVFSDRRLVARAGAALVLANARYWPAVAPVVRIQLSRWERSARAIHDPALQALALEKLREEHFNAEVAATLATLAPRAHRTHAVEAIVALEILYDYLDGLTESPSREALRDGHHLFRAFTDTVAPSVEPGRDYYRYHPQSEDGGYLQELVVTVRIALAQLPAAAAIIEVARASAARCAEAQVRAHAVTRLGGTQLERWATREAAGTPLEWREFLAGAASSVLAVHALIVAAADHRTTDAQAIEIDRAYLSIGVLITILDSLIDYQHDLSQDQPGYIQHYQDHDLLTRQLGNAAQRAATLARALHNGAHHVMTLVGVVAYYTSAPTATDGLARPLTAHIQRQLRPLITPTLAVMRAWRIAKQARRRWRGAARRRA